MLPSKKVGHRAAGFRAKFFWVLLLGCRDVDLG